MEKKDFKTPDATGKTAKQEKYEKKMAKYAANKARKEQQQKKKKKKNERNLMLVGETATMLERYDKIVNPQKYESPISELKEIEKVLVKKARYFYDNHLTFIHFPITYKGELNMIAAVSWGRNAKNYQVTSITCDGTNERNELDELWERVLDKELDVFCIKLVCSGKKLKPRYIKADTPTEAFEIACKENNVKLAFYAA